MKPAHLYSVLRRYLKSTVTGHTGALEALRGLRFALIQGPWRPVMIWFHQRWSRNPAFATAPGSSLGPIDVGDAVRRLERDAYAPGFRVPETTVEAIVRFMRADDSRRIDNPHHACPEIDRLVRDPALVAVARGFLGAEPILLESRMYWTIPVPDERGRYYGPADHGQFHYDVVDVKSVSVFVYLTDVDAESGPHVVISGSQRSRGLRPRTLDDANAERRFGGRMTTIIGSRRTGVFAYIECLSMRASG